MDRLIDAFGGPEAESSGSVGSSSPSVRANSSKPSAISLPSPAAEASAPYDVKLLLGGRYELDIGPLDALPGRLIPAFDRSSKQQVTLAFRSLEEPATALATDHRSDVARARSVSHPNVCRVHDDIMTPWGRAFVTEAIDGRTLDAEIRARAESGRRFGLEEFRQLGTDCFAGLAAIHARGLVHGDLSAAHLVLSKRKAMLLCLGLSSDDDADAPDGVERKTPADDVLALARTLWSLWTRIEDKNSRPRARPLKAQVRSDVPYRLSADELRFVFRSLSEEPAIRPLARRVRFHATRHTPSATLFAREHLDPGPPAGEASGSFAADRQALLITHAGTAPELVGELLPLRSQSLTLGRAARADVTVAERTISAVHAAFKWQRAGWTVEDLGSTNGIFGEVGYERQPKLLLRHGAEAQLGELRVMLVSFEADSRRHRRAREFLSRRDGLTGLLGREAFVRELDEDGLLADWAELPMQLVVYEVADPTRDQQGSIITTMLALRHSARRVLEMTEATTVALCPVPAGMTNAFRPRWDASPPRFGVSLVGLDAGQALQMAEAIAEHVRGTLPAGTTLPVRVLSKPPGMRARLLLQGGTGEETVTVC